MNESYDREQWLEERKRGIGASEVWKLFAGPEKQMDLWVQKTTDGHEDEQSEAMYWGQLLEEIVGREAARRMGVEAVRPWEESGGQVIWWHKDWPHMFATPDFYLEDGRVLEIKTTGRAAGWVDELPHRVYLQVQQQLACTGRESAVVAVLVAGQRLIMHDVQADEECQRVLGESVEEFWSQFVAPKRPPTDDPKLLGRFSDRLWKTKPGKKLVADDDGLAEMARRYQEITAKVREMEKEKNEIKDYVRGVMQDASVLYVPSAGLYWEITERQRKQYVVPEKVIRTLRLKKASDDWDMI